MRKRIVLLLAMALVSVLLVAAGCTKKQTQVSTTPTVQTAGAVQGSGEPVFNLGEYRGQVVMLNFWSTHCGHCQAEIPDFNLLQQKYGSQGLVILGMTMDQEPEEQVLAQGRQLGPQFPIYAGYIPQTLGQQFGPFSGFPTTYLISREGVVVKKVTGHVDVSNWEKDLKTVM